MDCKVCNRKDISPSMGGVDICGACDCGGICVIGGKKYLNLDYISTYQHLLSKSLEPKVEQFVCPTCHRESDSGVLLLKKEPKVEEIAKFLLEWGKENKAFQKNEGFRNKLATAIVEYLRGKR